MRHINGHDRREYRGVAKSIGTAATPLEALEMSGLNWNVGRAKLEMVGHRENRPVPGLSALVRSDTGGFLAVASDVYKVMNNEALMANFFGDADAMGVKLTSAGALDGGRIVFAVADLPHSFELPLGEWAARRQSQPGHNWTEGDTDRTVLRMIMKSGHVPGMRASYQLEAFRLVCLNGATISRQFGEVSVAHRGDTGRKLAGVRGMLDAAGEVFGIHAERARVLQSTPADRRVDRAYVVNLLQPEMWAAIVAETQERVHSAHPGRLEGADLLNAVIERTYTERFEAALQTRSAAAVLDAIQTQPGADRQAGNLWAAYNAVTYHVDHVRNAAHPEAALKSALYGDGAALKERALGLALEYAGAIGGRGAGIPLEGALG